MDFRDLFTDDDAVSPVIGVILMVAITVILAAVIGTFVLGLGDRVSQASPSATFTFNYNETPGSSITAKITHDGGQSVSANQVKVNVGGKNVYSEGTLQNSTGVNTSSWGDDITAGDSISVRDPATADGEAVKVIWTASGSDKTAVIGESEVNT